MQNRERDNSGTVNNEHLNNSNDPKSPLNEVFDSSEEYEGPRLISYQFRRWANNVWNLSNNVTNKLKELLRNNPTTNITTTSFAAEDGFRDERNQANGIATGWTASTNVNESSKHLNDGLHSRPRYHHQHVSYHDRNTQSRGNYCSYGKIFSHVAEDGRMPEIVPNGIKTGPFVMPHEIAAFPPVLVLPRLDQGVCRHQPLLAGFHHSRERCQNIRGEEYADGWYQRYNHSGIKEWGYEGPRGGENYSPLLKRHEIPEELSSVVNESKNRDPEKKFTRLDRVERKIETSDCSDYEPAKNYFDRAPRSSDFRKCKRRDGKPASSARRESRQCLRRKEIIGTSKISRNYGVNDACQNSGQSLKASSHRSKVRKVVWDMKLSDINSRELGSGSTSRDTLIAKSSEHSVCLDIENESCVKKFVDREIASNLKMPVKDRAKERKATISSKYDMDTVNSSEISRLIRTPSCIDVRSNGCQKQADGIVTANSIKWSSITENNFDSLLQSLRDRMETLSNIHATDRTEGSDNLSSLMENSNNRGGVNLTVATCMAGNHLPLSFESRNNRTDDYSVEVNENIRPSFSERIQDIWRDSRPRVWSSSSPRHKTTTSPLRCDFKSEKDVSSKLSLLGLNGQPALREYFSEYNSAVTLARILEKLIDPKSRSGNSPGGIPEMPNPKPRFDWHRSKTGLVDVGVQNSTPTSTTACQNSTKNSRHGLLKKYVTRGSFIKTCKSRAPEVSEESIIGFMPATQRPCRDVTRFAEQQIDARALSTIYGSSNVKNFLDDSIVHEINPSIVSDARLRYSTKPHSLLQSKCRNFPPASIVSQLDSSSSSKRSSLPVENRSKHPPDSFDSTKNSDSLTKRRQFMDGRDDTLSTVVRNQVEHEKQYVQFSTLESTTSPQQIYGGSLPVQFQATRVAKKSSDAALDGISANSSRTWWQKTLHSSKSSNLKRRITSVLRYVIKKYAGNDNHSEKNDIERTVTEDGVPTSSVRKKRECLAINRNLSKSINNQWDFDATVLSMYSAQRIDSFQAPVNNKVTVTTGTNTTAIKYCKTSSKDTLNKLTKQSKANMGKTARIEVSSQNNRTDSLDEKRLLNQTTLKLNGIVNVTEKLKPPKNNEEENYDDGSLPSRVNNKSSSNPIWEEEKKSSGLKNSKMSHSLSSESLLATELISPFDGTRARFTDRQNTVPILNNLPNYSLRSNVLFEDNKAEKSSDKDSSSQEGRRKVLFKHNRSSLLRANNSMLKKSAIRSFDSSKKLTRNKDIKILSILKSLTSSDTINEKESTRLLPVKENGSNKLDSEFIQPEKNKDDGKTGDLPSSADLRTKDISNSPSIHPQSEEKAKRSIAGETSYVDKKIRSNSASCSNSQRMSPNHGANKRNQSLPRGGDSVAKNSACLNEKRRLPKTKITSLNSKCYYDYPDEEKETPSRNLRSKKLFDNDKMKRHSITLNGKTIRSNYVAKEKEATPKNLRSNKLSYEEKIKGNSIPTEKKKAYCRSSPVLCRKNDRVEAGRDELLPRQLQENEKLELMESLPSEGSSNKVSLSNSGLIEIQSNNDEKSIADVKSVLPEKIDSPSTCEMEIVNDCVTKLKPQLVYSTVSKTAEHFFKQVDAPVQKPITISQNQETELLDGPRRDYLVSKPDKNTVKSPKLLRKSFVPPNPMIANSNPMKPGSDLCAANNSRRPAATNRYKTGDKSDAGLIKGRESRNKNTTKEMVEVVQRMLDEVISESMNMNRKTKSDIVTPGENIRESNTFDSEKTIVPSGEILLIKESVFPSTTDEVGEKCPPFIPPRQEEEFANRSPQGPPNIHHSTLVQPCSTSTFSSRIMPEVVDEEREDFQGASSLEKFSVTSKSIEVSGIEEIFSPLMHTETYITNIKSDFAIERFQLSEHRLCSLFNLTEILDKPEKLRLSMVNIHIASNVEFSESERQVNVRELINMPKNFNFSSNVEWNSPRVTDDERRNSKCKKVDGNVKIDNKVLEEKVKCSIENGVPLKTIIITDPAIIKPSNTVVDKNIRNIEFEKRRSGVERISTEVFTSSQASSSDANSERESSHSTWASHEIFTEDSERTESHAEKERREIMDEGTRAIDRNNLVSSTASVQLEKRATGQQRGTSIPRYKNIPLDKSVRKVFLT